MKNIKIIVLVLLFCSCIQTPKPKPIIKFPITIYEISRNEKSEVYYFYDKDNNRGSFDGDINRYNIGNVIFCDTIKNYNYEKN